MPAGFVNIPAVAMVASQARTDAGPAFHQRNLVISGVTRDVNGNPLAGCTVYLFNAGTMTLALTTTSDGSGNYSFAVDPTQTYFTVGTNGSGPVQGVSPASLVGI